MKNESTLATVQVNSLAVFDRFGSGVWIFGLNLDCCRWVHEARNKSKAWSQPMVLRLEDRRRAHMGIVGCDNVKKKNFVVAATFTMTTAGVCQIDYDPTPPDGSGSPPI